MAKNDGDAALLDLMETERRALVARLREVPDDAWSAPSLCAGWTVREVLAHLATPFLVSVPAMGRAVLRTRSLAGAMDVTARSVARRPVAELIDVLETNARSAFRPPGAPLAGPYTDVLVHGVDITWALGDDAPRGVSDGPADRLLPVLDFLVGPKARRGFVPAARIRGVGLEATDVGWSHPGESRVRGPALALAAALTGRRFALEHLSGPGVATLGAR